MKALSIPTFDASKFTWHSGVGTCEASTLGLKPGEVPYGHDYDVDNVADFGPAMVMVLHNPKKGTKCKFYLTGSSYGVLVRWHFESADRKIKLFVWDT